MIEPYPEVEFRDGDRVVPFHVAALLEGVETWKYTYDEAIQKANEQLLRRRLNELQREAVNKHFKDFG